MFAYSDPWQLLINTATTIVTFVMVFLIQTIQSRDTEAMQTKLDEPIRATETASKSLLEPEELDEQALTVSGQATGCPRNRPDSPRLPCHWPGMPARNRMDPASLSTLTCHAERGKVDLGQQARHESRRH